jgi:signal transduction histidine kinase/FixJ family two-component response regulator
MSRPSRIIEPLRRRRRSGTLDRHALGSALGIVVVAVLLVLTCVGTYRSVLVKRAETEAAVNAALTGQAAALSEEINRQLLAVDQTLGVLSRLWAADPGGFRLADRWAEASVLGGLTHDMLLVHGTGIVRQSSIPEAVGQSVAARDYMVYAKRHQGPVNGIYIGGASLDPVMRQWHLNIAAWLHHPDGSFAGAIVVDYRVASLLEVFRQATVGTAGLVSLIGLSDGRMRANLTAAEIDPNTDYAASAMLAAMKQREAGTWYGGSATDSVERFHAFRRLPGRDLVLVVAMERAEALAPATEWQWESARFSAAIVALLLFVVWQLLRSADLARRRGQVAADGHAMLAASNAQLQVAKAEAEAKAEQLEAALGGMTDGIYMMDSQFCLVEWNTRFPDLAGIPASLPRVGLPMQEMLRAQAKAGLFGDVDVEAEVARRMAAVRTLRFGTTERTRPDGRTIELRRRALPDGGFVTLYSDITEHKRVEAALREARATAESANAAKSRFVAIVSHEIRTPLNALLNTLQLLADSPLSASQLNLVTMAAQSGDALSSLINDILEMSRMEAGQLTLRPTVFALRSMVEGAMEIFHGQAEARGIRLTLAIADDVPAAVRLDAGRLRQVLINLLSNAVKFARAGEVVLAVERDWAEGPTRGGLFVAVRDLGPVIAAEDRQRLFQPFTRLDRTDGDQPLGTGLGLSICHHLITMMGGAIGCEPWSNGTSEGNTFWLTLPETAIVAPEPAPVAAAPAAERAVPRRLPPRARILLVEDVRANQVIAATLLRRVGHTVDIASNGAAAIEAVQRTPYDVVLMDIFMPGMTGQEAARQIRGLPGLAGDVPILALTAATTAEDERMFAEAGMDGALGKPVSLPELQAALLRHVWPGHPAGGVAERAEATMTEAAMTANDGGAVLAMARVDELRSTLPPEVLLGLVEACLADLEEKMPPFRRALASGDTREIEAQAHTIAGVAAGYGLASLEAKARAIMAAAHAGDTMAFGTAYAEASAAFVSGGAALREILQKQPV